MIDHFRVEVRDFEIIYVLDNGTLFTVDHRVSDAGNIAVDRETSLLKFAVEQEPEQFCSF
jgi:hypothetical protein